MPTQPDLKSWSRVIPAAKRFVVLAEFQNEAVLDLETGLVWEKSPGSQLSDWYSAVETAQDKTIGGRKAWRLPSVPELTSLIDPTQASPSLPAGHPFGNITFPMGYWTGTSSVRLPADSAFFVKFLDGSVNQSGKTGQVYVWCVRGPINADAY
jgi:hypothetical protein